MNRKFITVIYRIVTPYGKGIVSVQKIGNHFECPLCFKVYSAGYFHEHMKKSHNIVIVAPIKTSKEFSNREIKYEEGLDKWIGQE